MTVTSAKGATLAALQRRYLDLVSTELPAAAAAAGWSLRFDHCYGRVLLDAVVAGCWYDVLDRRAGPAYRQLSEAQLTTAVALAERLRSEGEPLLRRLDPQSLHWRGKPPKRAARRDRADLR